MHHPSEAEAFGGFYRGRRVLVTGHTGFKGAWLTLWLLELGADVTGAALPPENDDDAFRVLGLGRRCSDRVVDVRDADAVRTVMQEAKPEVVFHLAAQSLVRRSHAEPILTWDTNVGGTVRVLDALRTTPSVRSCVVVTSDKCYENCERDRPYCEDDALGGHDPYSASKAAAELVTASHRRSFLADGGCRVATARAGNVIGGGDRARDRLVADFMSAMRAGRDLVLRNPQATRPWQHVLEPLSGYLLLGARLAGDDGPRFARAFNFGPDRAAVVTVRDLASRLVAAWGSGRVVERPDPAQPHEAGLLSLDSGLARAELAWHPAWTLDDAIAAIVQWHRAEMDGSDLIATTRAQVARYRGAAAGAGLPWARGEE